jgi:hypothetical protein
MGVPVKTVQNVLATMVREGTRPLAVEGEGTKTAPRRFHALAPRLPEPRRAEAQE